MRLYKQSPGFWILHYKRMYLTFMVFTDQISFGLKLQLMSDRILYYGYSILLGLFAIGIQYEPRRDN